MTQIHRTLMSSTASEPTADAGENGCEMTDQPQKLENPSAAAAPTNAGIRERTKKM
jgi:hypothetical protein